jgi:uncharacterized protein YggE
MTLPPRSAMPLAALIGAGFVAMMIPPAALAQAEAPTPEAGGAAAFRATTLSLSAYGEVKATPDMATISLGVQTQAPSAARAMQANAERMSQVVAVLKKAGIEAKDIQTSGLNLGAQYDYQPNQAPRLNGYQASDQVTVRVEDLARLGPALDAVVSAGANQVNGIAFGLKDPKAAEDEARRRAVQALQAKAELYAGAAGYRVGRLVNISEGGGYSPRPMQVMAGLPMAAKGAVTPVEAGELDVRIDITGLYELAK